MTHDIIRMIQRYIHFQLFSIYIYIFLKKIKLLLFFLLKEFIILIVYNKLKD